MAMSEDMKSILSDFYHGKKVLITGHTGFKGSWLSIWLNELGAEVMGYSNGLPTNPCNFILSGLESRIKHITGDVRNFDYLKKVIDRFQPDVVFHLAAQAIVRQSYEIPKDTLDTNVMGTVNVLEAVRQSDSVQALVGVTSDKCYENREHVWGYRENDPMGGDDPYSSSKGAAELIFRSYLQSFFSRNGTVGAVTARAGNVIGGGDWAKDRIVTDTVRALAAGKPIEIRSPNAIRPWQHVLEPLSGYLVLGARIARDPKRFSGSWNFGPADSSAMSVGDLVTALIDAWGSGEWKDVSENNDPTLHEAGWLRLSCDKAHALLPWTAVLSFEENIHMTVKWYKFYYDYPSSNMYQFCAHQIREYMRIAAQRGQEWAKY